MKNNTMKNFLSILMAAGLLASLGVVSSHGAPAPNVCKTRVELVPRRAATGDAFGTSVSIQGQMIAAGAPFDDTHGEDAGSVFTFERQAGSWQQDLEWNATSGAGGELGHSVSITELSIVAGAYRAASGEAGAAYRFDRTTPSDRLSLVAATTAAGDHFGWAVAVDGDYVVVTAPGADREGAVDAGAAYVFDRATGSQLAQLIPVRGSTRERFGFSAAIDGDRIVIGTQPQGSGPGSAFVFERGTSGTWTEAARLLSGRPQSDDRFGAAVAVSGDTILVGAPGDTTRGVQAGAAYVFEQGSGGWNPSPLLAGDGDGNDEFGLSVAIRDDAIVVGAAGAAGATGRATGAAYRFWRAGGGWWPGCKLVAAAGVDGDRFGTSVAIEPQTGENATTSFTVVGAPQARPGGIATGAVYVFRTSQHGEGPDPDEPPANPDGSRPDDQGDPDPGGSR